MEKKNNKKVFIICEFVVFLMLITIFMVILINTSNIMTKTYEGEKTTQLVEKSKLSDEEKELYSNAISRNDESLLDEKTVKEIIDGERQRQAQEKKQIEEQKAKEEKMKKIEEDSSNILLKELNTNFTNYINGIDTFTYTFNTSNINFERIRMYYDNTVKAVETFKKDISQYEELEEKNSTIMTKLDEYIEAFDKATQKTSNAETVINNFENLSNKFEVCYEMIFKNISNGEDIHNYIN